MLIWRKCGLTCRLLQIYRTIIQQEETKNGQKSDRPFNVTAKEALAHPETRARYTARECLVLSLWAKLSVLLTIFFVFRVQTSNRCRL